MDKKIFETEMVVRDYECDIQGIVNNANYLHYFEHTRHIFLKTTGLSFSDLHNRGIDVVVARMNLQYKTPLHPDDHFISSLTMEKERVCYIFNQTIRRVSDGKICCKARVECASIVNGRLGISQEVEDAFAEYIR